MTKSAYFQKLLDPRWQKKRLDVMSQANFSCQLCGDAEITLNVHHKEYFKGHEPWEYEVDQLTCVCQPCHESLHFQSDVFKKVCSRLPIDGPNSKFEVAIFLAGLINMPYEDLLQILDGEDCQPIRRKYSVGQKFNLWSGHDKN